MPKNASIEARKRMTSMDLKNPQAKKSKINPTPNQSQSTSNKPSLESIVDEFVTKLNVQENVADLVMVTMAFLPEQVPSGFLNAYKPISDAGSLQQKRNLSKMIALLLNEAGLLSISNTSSGNEHGNNKESKNITIDDLDNDDEDNDESELNTSKLINPIKSEKKEFHEKIEHNADFTGKLSRQQSTPLAIKPPANLQSLVHKKEITKSFKLSDVTSNSKDHFNLQSLEELLYKSYTRILGSEREKNCL
jgi:hypothetical protein